MKRKAIRIIDESFRKAPKNYIIQSLLAAVAVAVILNFVGVLTQTAIVASLGASTFIAFAMPDYVTAQPRRLIGGNIVGLLCGLLCYYIFLTGHLGGLSEDWELIFWVAGALSVGLAIFLMTVTNTEHPPAAGVALGFVVNEWTYQTIIFVIVYATSLSIIKRLLRRYLRDLV